MMRKMLLGLTLLLVLAMILGACGGTEPAAAPAEPEEAAAEPEEAVAEEPAAEPEEEMAEEPAAEPTPIINAFGERDMFTLPVGLVFIQQGSYIQRGLAYAGAFIASAPVLVFYAFFQRKIIAGITMTGMAGQ
jgi:hypothetical protein